MKANIVILSACIWAVVILASALAVPSAFSKLIPILGGGAAAHLILVGSQLRRL